MSLIDDGCYDAKLFRFVYRYIDDLLILNDNGHFDNIYRTIYPDVLQLNSTGTSSFHSSFLDLDISVEERQFKYTLYDKRNNFNFNVISLPNLCSNIPINNAYGTFYSQVVRLFNANNNAELFIENVKNLITKLCHQNFNRRVLLKFVSKFIKKYKFCLVTKFWKIFNCSMFI